MIYFILVIIAAIFVHFLCFRLLDFSNKMQGVDEAEHLSKLLEDMEKIKNA
jgi:hypothetical protein